MTHNLTTLHPGAWAVLDGDRRVGVVEGAPSLGYGWSDPHGCHGVRSGHAAGLRPLRRAAAVDELLAHARAQHAPEMGAC